MTRFFPLFVWEGLIFEVSIMVVEESIRLVKKSVQMNIRPLNLVDNESRDIEFSSRRQRLFHTSFDDNDDRPLRSLRSLVINEYRAGLPPAPLPMFAHSLLQTVASQIYPYGCRPARHSIDAYLASSEAPPRRHLLQRSHIVRRAVRPH